MLNSKVLLFALLGVNLLGGGLFLIRSTNVASSSAVFDVYQNTSSNIKVDVSGAVKNPGSYTLTDSNRVEDAIASAGGFLSTADQDWLNKYLNLAQTLSDGQKIYIPAKTDTKPAENKISINAGSKVALISLKGVGEVTADKIIAARPYAQLSELWEKKIVSQKVFEEISDQISLW